MAAATLVVEAPCPAVAERERRERGSGWMDGWMMEVGLPTATLPTNNRINVNP